MSQLTEKPASWLSSSIGTSSPLLLGVVAWCPAVPVLCAGVQTPIALVGLCVGLPLTTQLHIALQTTLQLGKGPEKASLCHIWIAMSLGPFGLV